MSFLKTIAERYPLAMAAFVKWFTARNTLRPCGHLFRVPIEDLPVEFVYGLSLEFFADNGVMVTTSVTTKGRMRCTVFVRRVVGSFRKAHTGRLQPTATRNMEYAVGAAFRAINTRLHVARGKVVESDDSVVIGLDTEELMRVYHERTAQACV